MSPHVPGIFVPGIFVPDKNEQHILYNYIITYIIQLYAVSIGVYKLVLVKLMRPICSLYSIQIKKNIDEERNCHTVLLTSSQGLGMSR